ncbi:MAG: NAD-dependent epimerase/dehydratase family protein [Synechococcus sp.]
MRLSLVGCGYVGQAIAQHLQGRADLELTVTTTSEERCDELSAIADQVLVISADDPDGLLAALDGRDAVIFCLGPKGNRQVDAAGYRHTFNDSFRCLEQLLPQLPVLQQIIYTGSCSIYGDAGGGWVDESTSAQPRDEHGAVLLEAERQLLAMGSPQRRVCILRLGALYGPQREFKQRFARSTQHGRGERFTNWVHRDDAAAAAIAALDGHWHGIVNVVDDAPVPLAELLNASLAQAGLAPITWQPASEPGNPGLNRRISNRLLKQRGFQLNHPRIALLNGGGAPQREPTSTAEPTSPQR